MKLCWGGWDLRWGREREGENNGSEERVKMGNGCFRGLRLPLEVRNHHFGDNLQQSIPVPYTYKKSGIVAFYVWFQVAAYRDVNGDECGRDRTISGIPQ